MGDENFDDIDEIKESVRKVPNLNNFMDTFT